MRHYVATLAPTVLVGGCSLIYNPSNIGQPPADATDAPMIDVAETIIDAAIDAPPLADADFTMLSLEKVAPVTLLEGQGTGGSRQAIVVVRGMHISPDANILITPSTNLTLGTKVVSANGNFIAVPVTVAQDDAMDTELVDLTIVVDQPGANQMLAAGSLKLQYLPEFPAGGTVATAGLATTLYSKVDTGNVTFTGTDPVIIRAVSSITIGNVNISGEDGAGGTNGAGVGGPGGCDGGAPGTAGGCPLFAGGGLGASGSNGGGGGGFATDGNPGATGVGGGAMHGNAQIVNYVTSSMETNRSGGGGGGQQGGLATAGAGGGGGGTFEATAGGNVTVGAITANGGKGGNGTGIAGLPNAGAGGGGSGGVIVLRSTNGTLTANGAISAIGGLGGTPAGSGGGGGFGSAGRVRIDVAAGARPTANPAAHRGSTFNAATPLIVTEIKPTLELFGQSGDKLDGWLIDHDNALRLGEPVDQMIANGTVNVEPTLIPGYNKLCFTHEPGVRPTTATVNPLADTCIEIAYLP